MRRSTIDHDSVPAARRRLRLPVAVAVAGLAGGLLVGCGHAAAPAARSAALAVNSVPQATTLPMPFVSPTPPPPVTPKPRPKPKPVRVRLSVSGMTPTGKGPYGVAMVVSVSFDRDLDRLAQRRVQARLKVVTNKPIGSAAWAWTSSRTAMLRPINFWPANTKVTVFAHMTGFTLPVRRGVQVYGRGVSVIRFTIGRSMVTSIDGNNQMGTVRLKGKVVRHVPVSMGKEGWRTRNGVKAIFDRELDHVYTNTAVGDFTESYRLVAHYNVRLTWSGEFLHSAPWAYGRLGSWPGSHGCTNAYDSDAGWFYYNALDGDPVVYKNTGGATMELDNGLGGPWNVPWKKWKAMSVGKTVVTRPGQA